MLAKISLKPGINRDTTNYTNSGGWFDSDFVRFRNGLPEKIGGWTKIYASQTPLIGACRKLYDWSDIVGNQYLACPTNVKLYVDNSANILDVTPLRRSVTLGLNPIYTYAGNSSEELLGDNVIGMAIDFTGDNFYIRTEQSDIEQPNVIVITDVNHGAVVGDYITISGSTSVNGITAAQINKEFVVFQVIDANSYAVVTTGYATATGAGGGASVVVKYQFHPGISSSVTYAGWGSGPWGGISGSYGWGFGPDTTISTYYTGLWTVDNYGEDMIACPRNVTNAVTLGNTPISTSNTSNVVTVTQVNHALSNGMAIVIGGVTSPIGGIPVTQLNGSQTVTVANSNAYTFTVSNVASATETGGTNAVIYTPSIVYWDITDQDGPAVSIGDLGAAYAKKYMPYVATEVMVSDQNRQVIVFGSNPYDVTQKQDKMIIRWSDSQDPTNWDIADTTKTAGEQRLSAGSYIITAIQSREEILVWTDSTLYTMTYVGPPSGYGFNTIGSGFDIIGPNSKIVAGSVAYWMGSQNFYMYDGKIQPMPCTVRDYVFLDISKDDGDKVYCSSDSGNNEIIWFYPSESQGGTPGFREVDRYVVYNYIENAWYYGSLARTAWLDRRTHPYPRAVSPDGYLYNHENGFDDGSTSPASPINAYIQSSAIEIDDGDSYMFVNRVLPDLTFRNSTTNNGVQPVVKFIIRPQDFPGAPIYTGDERNVQRSNAATLTVNQFTNQVFTRLRARSVALRVESDVTGAAWRLGTPRLDMRKDGRK